MPLVRTRAIYFSLWNVGIRKKKIQMFGMWNDIQFLYKSNRQSFYRGRKPCKIPGIYLQGIVGGKMVYCLFEQSGTFKNFFRSKGYEAVDVDIENRFGQTDMHVDLFREIYKDSGFIERITPKDFVFAFFPCTCFSTQFNFELHASGHQYKNYSVIEKIQKSKDAHAKRDYYYETFCLFYTKLLRNKIRAVIENPYHDSWLYKTFPIKPSAIILDRRLYGDKLKKPTMFYFLNFVRSFNLHIAYVPKECEKIDNMHGIERSLIQPEFVQSFYDLYLEGVL